MQTRLLQDHAAQRTHAVVLNAGEGVLGCMRKFVEAVRVSAARVTAVGAFSDAELGYFDWDKRRYEPMFGHVRPTREVIVTQSPGHLQRVKDDETGLALIRPKRGTQ